VCRREAGVDGFGVFEDDGIEGVGSGGEETGVAEIGLFYFFWRIITFGNNMGTARASVSFEADLLVG